ncbi:MAG: hypothetical protein AAFQ63_12450 [Cyanobacteria bacterium J06621_11]
MSIWQRMVRVFVWGVIAFILCISAPALSYAEGLQTAQFTEKAAVLVGPKADSPVPLYLRPAANQPNVGYGMNGSPVTVLEQVASFLPEADQDSAWNHIRLNDAPYTEGWIQGRFLTITDDKILHNGE